MVAKTLSNSFLVNDLPGAYAVFPNCPTLRLTSGKAFEILRLTSTMLTSQPTGKDSVLAPQYVIQNPATIQFAPTQSYPSRLPFLATRAPALPP